MTVAVATTARASGRPYRRVEDPRLLSGRGRYVEDIDLKACLHLAFVRSPYPSATIGAISVDAARAVPGVLRVATAADLDGVGSVPTIPLPFVKIPPYHALARERVAAVGTPVVAIVAESAGAARDAADLVEIEFDPQPAVSSAEQALAVEAPQVHPEVPGNLCYRLAKTSGDVEAAFRDADVTVQVRVDSPRVAPIPLEPRGVVAEPGQPDDPTRLTVWLSSQAPHGARADLARALGLEPATVRVISPDVGGGFGAKSGATAEYILACYFALQLGRPVKWVATRGEDIQATTQGRDMVIYVDIAAKRDGTLVGLKMRNVANLGAYLHSATAIPPTFILTMAGGCYRVDNVSVETNAVFTNTPPTGPYRGAGRPETVLAIERAVDALARALSMDPVALRHKNFIGPDEFPYTNAVGSEYDSGNYGAALDRALELIDYPARVAERDAARARGELMGIGVSTFVEPSGSVGGETGLVRVEEDGTITFVSGSHSHGQGHETSFAQLIADEMHVPMERVRVLHGDTGLIESGVGTFASRSMMLGGSAGVLAARKVVEKARRIAAHVLETTVEDIESVEDGFGVAGAGSRRVSWQEVARVAADPARLPDGETPGLEQFERFDTPHELWPFGAHIAVVRIDRDTAAVKIERIVAVDDCGTVINPLIVEGQVQGGIAQAVGQALIEQVVFDEQGQMLSGSLGDYAVPRAGDIPPLVLGHTVTPTPLNPIGAKGVGEAGTNGLPPAIANAVLDALSPIGVADLDLPYTADRVWAAMQAARASKRA